MAIATAYTAVNMNAVSVWYGTPTIYNSTHIQINAGLNRADYYGSGFTFNLTGVTGGTITRYDASYNGVVQYSISGLSLNAVTVNGYLNTANANGLMSYAFAGNDTFNGSAGNDALNSYNGNDTIYGNVGNDILNGGAGNDNLFGGAGNDTLNGGTGIDWAYYNTATSGITVNLSLTSTQITGGAGSDTLISIENLYGGYFNDLLTGDTLNNRLFGNAGNDVISGGAGNDDITGGAGNDILIGGAGNDWLDYDTANQASTAGITINLALTTAQITGGAGTDTISGFESVGGSDYNDNLYGNALANVLHGRGGNDLLVGGAGKDTLIGGGGADRFDFNSITDSVNRDTIFDFVRGADKIDLSTIDANTLAAGNQAFTLISGALAFTGAGQIKFANGILYGNVNGDNVADFEIELTGITSLAATDFVL